MMIDGWGKIFFLEFSYYIILPEKLLYLSKYWIINSFYNHLSSIFSMNVLELF